MKTLWLTAILAVSSAAPAAAADLSARVVTKAPATDTAGYNWGGWYAGGNLGGSWSRGNVSDVFVSGATPIANQQAAAAATPHLSPDGFTGGGQVGHNSQVDRWLFGVEADASYFGLKQSRSVSAPFPVGLGAFTTSNAVTADWLVSLRPRVGYAVDRTLLYATGGLALTELKFGTGYSDSTGQNEAASSSKTVAGWTAGAGIEHAFSTNWSAKVEYLYSDFGKQTVTGPVMSGPTSASGVISRDIDLKTNTVRGGLNYHFGGPSVARY
jgi:outer membrane immunogenic protein